MNDSWSVRITPAFTDPYTGENLIYVVESCGPKLLDLNALVLAKRRGENGFGAISSKSVDPVTRGEPSSVGFSCDCDQLHDHHTDRKKFCD